jgi:hypothetical protein
MFLAHLIILFTHSIGIVVITSMLFYRANLRSDIENIYIFLLPEPALTFYE